MSKEETIKILGVIKVAYPNSFKDMSQADLKALVGLWVRQFEDYTYNQVLNAVDSIISIDTSPFMPSIGRIKEAMFKNSNKKDMTEFEAWNILYKAICNSGYHATEEFEKLPPLIKSIVNDPERLKEWGMMPSDTVNSVVASNFQRSYRARKKSFQEETLIPIAVKKALGIETEDTEDDKPGCIGWQNDERS